MPEYSPLFRWMVRGFQGLCTMLEAEHQAGGKMDPTTRANFAHWMGRLNAILEAQNGEKPGDPPPAPPAARGPRR